MQLMAALKPPNKAESDVCLEKPEGLQTQQSRWATWAQPLPAVTITCCSTQPRHNPPKAGRTEAASPRGANCKRSTQPCKAQTGKEKLMIAQDRNTGGSFKPCPYCEQQNGLFKKLSWCTSPAQCRGVSLMLQSSSWTQHRPSLLCCAQWDEVACSSAKSSARGISSSQFKCMQSLENQEVPVQHARALWDTKALLQFLWDCLIPFPQTCLEISPLFGGIKGKGSTAGWWARSTLCTRLGAAFIRKIEAVLEDEALYPAEKSAEEQNSGWSAGNCEGVNCRSASTKRNMLLVIWGERIALSRCYT